MTTIRVMHDEKDAETFRFGAGVTRITLGRRPENDVRIGDRSVSGSHARIDIDDGRVMIEDLASTNGTYLNGNPVTRTELREDDELLVGKVLLQVLPRRAAHADSGAAAAGVGAIAGAAAGGAFDDDDDELDESMRAALALYSDDDEPATQATPAFVDEDDDMDFSEDARLFAQRADASVDRADASASFVDDDDRLPEADESFDEPMGGDGQPAPTVRERAKAALGREVVRPRLHAVSNNGERIEPPRQAVSDTAQGAVAGIAVAAGSGAAAGAALRSGAAAAESDARSRHPLDAMEDEPVMPTHELDSARARSRGAVIEIKNGAKSGQILPIDKPVTTLGRPGIQIAAIMRKPDGYFLMHIESDDSVDRPTLNADSIGDEPVLLHSGDELNVAGIDVEFMLS